VYPTALSQLYDRIARASASGDATTAHAAFLELVGLGARREPRVVPSALPARAAPMLQYFTPRLIDRYALLGGARHVAKFEDLSVPAANKLETSLRARGLRTLRTGPYQKRFDVSVASHFGTGDLYNVISSRFDEAEAVVKAEEDRSSDGARRAGLALGYPPCCVEHFATTERSLRAQREGVNEAAIRSPLGADRDAPWEMNPLSSMAPIGFVPCSVTCHEAMSFAHRVLAAVRTADPRGRALIERVLRRPILFFRYPIFYVLDGAAVDRPGARAVRYRLALLNDAGTAIDSALRAWAYDEIGAVLERGDEVVLGEDTLEIREGARVLARWPLDDPSVPMLMRFITRERSADDRSSAFQR
jgi:hypothetical protein